MSQNVMTDIAAFVRSEFSFYLPELFFLSFLCLFVATFNLIFFPAASWSLRRASWAHDVHLSPSGFAHKCQGLSPPPPIQRGAIRWWRDVRGEKQRRIRPPTPLPPPVCFLFYLCNMCFGLGPEQGSAAIIRLWASWNFITCLLQCQGR